MSPTVYCYGTKKQANEVIARDPDNPLASSRSLCLKEFNMFTGDKLWLFNDLPDGAVFKFYKKTDYSGQPIAKSYGVKKGGKIK